MGLVTFIVFLVAVLLAIAAIKFLIGLVQKVAVFGLVIVAGILVISLISGEPLLDQPTVAVVTDGVGAAVDVVKPAINGTINIIKNISSEPEENVDS